MALSELVIESGPKPRILQGLRESWAYRGTVMAFAERDVRVKYKQAILGIGWAVIQPLAFMLVFTFTFNRFADFPGVPKSSYAGFTLSALVMWQFLSTGVSFGAQAVLTNAPLVRKVYFPREVPVLGSIAAAGVDFVIAFALFMVLGPFLGAKISFTWLFGPVFALLLAPLSAGIACAFAALNVYYRDFRYLLPFALQLWLLASPVAYPLALFDEPWRTVVVIVNPAAGILEAGRQALALGEMPDFTLIATSALGSILVFLIGYRIFKTLEPSFADVI